MKKTQITNQDKSELLKQNIHGDIGWLRHTIGIETQQQLEEIQKSSPILNNWARTIVGVRNRFKSMLARVLLCVKIIQRTFRKYIFRRDRMLETRMNNWLKCLDLYKRDEYYIIMNKYIILLRKALRVVMEKYGMDTDVI
eukprot:Tbor_TRINITY_DN6095_c2_g4::TRINITY_DN6095_c2_g4_i1::g.10366::m.10366